MKIVNQLPPNFEAIKAAFPKADLTFAIYAWGDKIYNPGGYPLAEHLIVHEQTHGKQQGAHIEQWWDKYLHDSSFRLRQEVEAYGNQYKFVKSNSSRQISRAFLKKIAKDLSSALYGNLIGFDLAKRSIEHAATD